MPVSGAKRPCHHALSYLDYERAYALSPTNEEAKIHQLKRISYFINTTGLTSYAGNHVAWFDKGNDQDEVYWYKMDTQVQCWLGKHLHACIPSQECIMSVELAVSAH